MLSQLVKFLLEGLAVALASHLIARNKLDVKEIVVLGLTAAAVFLILEYYTPDVATGARRGAGFGLGWRMVGGAAAAAAAESEVSENTGAAEPDKEEESDKEESDKEEESDRQSPNNPYKLIDGIYSHKVLLAGYNENAEAANTIDKADYP
jgi:hypothetical protein